MVQSSKFSKKAIVIGAGVAGLASAIRLAIKGYDVSVYEASKLPGGKLNNLTIGQYRFDAGPSLFTMPQFIEELFILAGKNPKDYFNYQKCKISCNYFFEDKTKVVFYSDKTELTKEIESKLGESKRVQKYLKKSQFIFNATKSVFLEKSLHKISTYLNLNILKTVFATPFLGLFTTLHKRNERNFKNKKLVQLFDRYATYNGSSPFQTPGIMSLIPHLENGIGTFIPKGGMYDITDSLYRLAKDLGVVFEFNSKVDRILHKDGVVEGVKIGNSEYKSEIVISNVDIKMVYGKLLTNVKIPKKVMEQEPSSSAMIFYWGINKSFKQLDLHNILFSADYKEEFESIFTKKRTCSDPTVYINITKKYVGEDAPEGKENWFVMVNVPSNSGQNWDELRCQIRANVIKKINSILEVDIEELIELEDYLDPIRIEHRTSSYAGALYGSSSNSRMAAFFRNPNFSSIKGLYFVGGSVHPGGGIPLCLLSSKIATDFITEN